MTSAIEPLRSDRLVVGFELELRLGHAEVAVEAAADDAEDEVGGVADLDEGGGFVRHGGLLSRKNDSRRYEARVSASRRRCVWERSHHSSMMIWRSCGSLQS